MQNLRFFTREAITIIFILSLCPAKLILKFVTVRLKRSLKALFNLKEIIMKVDNQILWNNPATSLWENKGINDFSLNKLTEDELKQILELETCFCEDFDKSNADLKVQYDKCILIQQKISRKISLKADIIWDTISNPKQCKISRYKSVTS